MAPSGTGNHSPRSRCPPPRHPRSRTVAKAHCPSLAEPIGSVRTAAGKLGSPLNPSSGLYLVLVPEGAPAATQSSRYQPAPGYIAPAMASNLVMVSKPPSSTMLRRRTDAHPDHLWALPQGPRPAQLPLYHPKGLALLCVLPATPLEAGTVTIRYSYRGCMSRRRFS